LGHSSLPEIRVQENRRRRIRDYTFPSAFFLQPPRLLPAGTAVADYWAYPLTETNGSGSPVLVDQFVRATYLGSLLSIPYNPDIALTLDDDCLRDHARVLVPRAVAYAAGVLESFFRYELEVAVPYGAPAGAFSYRLLRSGTKGPGDSGLEATSANGRMLAFGVGADESLVLISALGTWGDVITSPVGEVSGRSSSLVSLPQCFDRYLYVFDGWIEGAKHVVATYVDSEMAISPLVPGTSISEGFRASIVRPKSSQCPFDDPLNVPLNGILVVQGICEDGEVDDLGTAEWPIWTGPAPREYREYRIVFEGDRDTAGTPLWVRYEKHYGELVNEMSPVLQELTEQPNPGHSWITRRFDTGNGHWFRMSSRDDGRQWSDVRIRNGLLEDTFLEECGGPSAQCLCSGDVALWYGSNLSANHGTPGFGVELPILTGDSRLSIGVPTLSADASVWVGLTLTELHTGTEEDVMVEFGAGGAQEVSLGTARPDLFSAGQAYQTWRTTSGGGRESTPINIVFGGCEILDEPSGRRAERSGAVDYIRILP
ncbi:MAG: hypothetical protein ACNA8S_09740, partial [Deferrisomatales bacterium]